MAKEQDKNKDTKVKNRVKRILFTLLAIAFWVGLWWIAALLVGKEGIRPTPDRVCVSLWEACLDGQLFLRAGKSLLGIAAGYLAGVTVGFLLSFATARVGFLHTLFSPLLTVVRATPVASFILILWVFFARETVPAVSVMLIVTPIVWANCETGFLSKDKKLSEVARVYSFSFVKSLRYLYLPSVYPYFRTALLTAMGMAWKAGVAAEVLCTPDGTLGQMIWASKRDIQTADLFGWTVVVIAVCCALEKLLGLLLKAPRRAKEGSV